MMTMKTIVMMMVNNNLFFFTGSCASAKSLTCLHLLYSFPCINDDDCFESGMTCCETKCEYGKKMCVPRGKT